ncbi:hypothetical protein DL93DRAFT_2097411 [Clavulina sp. PMI_390]|nr:hypothetical protein DL93DRAFT_2097411 [Clavulina sp. PMI_390]
MRNSNCTTIDDLPSEILGEVFLSSVQLCFAKLQMQDLYHSSSDVGTQLFALLRTCKRWNSLVMHDPLLWCFVAYEWTHGDPHRALGVFLQRSKSTPIHVHIGRGLSDILPTNPTKAAPQAFNELAVTLMPHLERLTSFSCFGCFHAQHFFPFRGHTPNLQFVHLRDTYDTSSVKSLFHSYTPLRVLKGEMAFNDPLALIDRSTLIQLDCTKFGIPTWDPSSLLGFNNLRKIRLPLLCLNVNEPPHLALQLPELRVLLLEEPCSIFGHYFADLPALIHLSITSGVPRFTLDSMNPAERFGGDALSPAWPELPSLLTLTIDHMHVGDIIPTLYSSSSLIALHIHGFRGFTEVLQALELSSSQGASDNLDLQPLLVPKLTYLRLWPATVRIDYLTSDSLESHDELYDFAQSLSRILELRPQLHIEIGVFEVNCAIDSNRASNFHLHWDAQWSMGQVLDALRPQSYVNALSGGRVRLVSDVCPGMENYYSPRESIGTLESSMLSLIDFESQGWWIQLDRGRKA